MNLCDPLSFLRHCIISACFCRSSVILVENLIKACWLRSGASESRHSSFSQSQFRILIQTSSAILLPFRIKRVIPWSNGTVAKLAMRQPFVLFKGLTFQKLCLPGAFRPGDHHNKMLRPGLCVVHASPQYL